MAQSPLSPFGTEIETRRLNDLKASNPYLRLGTNVEDLEKSISTVGLIAPLVISEDDVILAGARRYQALLNLGYTEAPVFVIKGGELEKELISIDENLVRKDLSKIELESHLRRAKEIYQALNPEEEFTMKEEMVSIPTGEMNEAGEEIVETKKVVKLPAEKFLNMVAEKTGLSPKQIHEAISRDEQADETVKVARKNGELSLSQTNELVKLSKKDQKASVEIVKSLPVKDIKQFVKTAKAEGVSAAIQKIPNNPHAREFGEIESLLKRLQKRLKQLELEGITINDLPKSSRDIVQGLFVSVELEAKVFENQYSEQSYQ